MLRARATCWKASTSWRPASPRGPAKTRNWFASCSLPPGSRRMWCGRKTATSRSRWPCPRRRKRRRGSTESGTRGWPKSSGSSTPCLFDSGDLEIIRGEPSVRRRFLDLEIAQTSPRYVHALGSLSQGAGAAEPAPARPARRAGPGSTRDSLPAWNERLAQHGARLIERRRLFLERLALLARRRTGP